MSLTFNRQAAIDEVAARVASGLDHALDEIEREAIKNAPVRKRRTERPRSHEEAVRAIHEDFVPDRARQSAKFGGNYPATNIRSFRRAASTAIRAGGKVPTFAGRTNRGIGAFKFAFYDRAGNEVRNLAVGRGGKVVAAADSRGGNLKSKIRRTEVEIDGSSVSGRVVSGAPYSKYPEYGFTHVGGVRVPAQPFFRPAVAGWVSHWRSSFKSGAR